VSNGAGTGAGLGVGVVLGMGATSGAHGAKAVLMARKALEDAKALAASASSTKGSKNKGKGVLTEKPSSTTESLARSPAEDILAGARSGASGPRVFSANAIKRIGFDPSARSGEKHPDAERIVRLSLFWVSYLIRWLMIRVFDPLLESSAHEVTDGADKLPAGASARSAFSLGSSASTGPRRWPGFVNIGGRRHQGCYKWTIEPRG
jgi:hypothetical protein